jgi:O-antigen/teichoic acid export membrane protein
MIDPQTRLGRNALWMILSRFGAQGLAVVFTVLLARRLGSAGFGEYAFIAAVLFVANALTTFGTDMLLIREIAAHGDLSRLPAALIVQLVLSVLFIAAVWMFGRWIPHQSPETITALNIYSLALIPLAFFTVFTTALRGLQRMDTYSLLSLIVSALQVGVVSLPNINIVSLSVLLLSVQTVAALFAGLFCACTIPHFWQSWRFTSFSFSEFLKEATPIAFLTLVTMLYQRLNVGMLSIMMGATATGIYSAAFRAVEASKTAHLAVFAALYPAMASAMPLRSPQGRSNTSTRVWCQCLVADEEIASSVSVSTPALAPGASVHPSATAQGYSTSGLLAMTYPKFLLAGAAIISLILSVLAKPLVILLYGIEFTASANVLQILAWTLIPFTVNTYLTLFFLASGREGLVGRALTVSLLGLLILNLWWIPAKGPEGSAWAALAAECVQSAFLLAGARSRVHLQGEVHEFSELS